MPQLLLTLLLIAIGWFLIIRPQQQRLREQRALVADLHVGDRVITAGGLHGTLVEVAEETVQIEVAAGVVVTLARPAVGRRLDTAHDATTAGAAGGGETALPDRRDPDVPPAPDGGTS